MSRRFFVGLALAALLAMATVLAVSSVAAPRATLPLDPSTFPGSNGRIAFISARDGNPEVYTMNPDGSGQSRLTFTGAAEYDPEWSPDGRKIAFRSGRDGNDEIYTMSANGSNQTRLTFNDAVDMMPAWSEDGSMIAFVSERDEGNREIYSMTAAGESPTNLTHSEGHESHPDWDPIGAYIAYERNDSGNTGIYLMDTDGSDQTHFYGGVPGPDYVLAQEPSWSPDGLKLAFVSYIDGNPEITTANFDASDVTNLSQNEAHDWWPAWSPDGSQLTFSSDRGGVTAVYTMDAADGSNQINRSGGGFNYLSSWGPAIEDGDGVAISVEDGAPNGGDGNNDGTPDSQQSHVASLPNYQDGHYLTLVSPNGTRLTGVTSVDNPSPGDAPAGAVFPFGFLSYSVKDVAPGGTILVDILTENSADVDAFYKFGPTADNTIPHWFEFMADGSTGAEELPDRWRIKFIDGGRGDSDLQANGIITDPGAIARRPVETCKPLTGVEIVGHAAADLNQPLTLAAAIQPETATGPITYQWSIGWTSGQGTPQATYQWATTGLQTVSVTAANCDMSMSVTDEHQVTVSLETPTVRVNDESGDPVEGAAVFRNGQLAGHTGSDGRLPIAGLKTGDQLVARRLIYQEDTPSTVHNGWKYRLYITSLDIPRNGEPTPYVVANPAGNTLVVRKGNTLIGFNLVVSVAWDATLVYLVQLRQGYEAASETLYDASDGQMVFERVSIFDNAGHFQVADVGISPAKSTPGDGARSPVRFEPPPVYGFTRYDFGRSFDGRPANPLPWSFRDAYRELARGFAAYGFELKPSDHYYNTNQQRVNGVFCTSPDIVTNTLDDVNASLMAYPPNATEFAMRDVPGLWELTCMQTRQWQVYGKSDWETIRDVLGDKQQPARWTIITPKERGGAAAGPHHVPVDGWTSVSVAGNAETGVCAVSPTYQIVPPKKFTLEGGAAILIKTQQFGLPIDQGLTDSLGRITIVGAQPGDLIFFSGHGINYNCKTAVCALLGGEQGIISQFQPVQCIQERAAAGDMISVPLDLQPLAPDVSVAPGDGPNQVRVTVSMTQTLDGPPVVSLTQTAATATIPVAMTQQGAYTYTGIATLNIAYEPAGVMAVAVDSAGEHAETYSNFSVATVDEAADTLIRSADGRAELFLPAGSLAGDGRLNIAPTAPPGEAPLGYRFISGSYEVIAAPGAVLAGAANLTVRHGPVAPFILPAVGLYRWDGLSWDKLDGTSGPNLVSAAVDSFGIYALLSTPSHWLYVPVARR